MPLAKQRSTINFYVRRAVPRDLVATMGKREIWRTLKTPDKPTAKKRSRKVEAEIDRMFDRARAQRSPQALDEVPIDALARLARETYWSEMARFEEDITMRPQYLLDGLDIELDELKMGLCEGSWSSEFLEAINERLEAGGFKLRDGVGYWKAVQLISRALVASNRTAYAHATGDWAFSFGDPLVTAEVAPVPGVSAAMAHGLTVRDLIARFDSDPGRANVGASSKKQYVTMFKVLLEVVGKDARVTQITRDDCRRVRDKFLERKLAASTVDAYLTNLSALFQYAVREEYMDRNPAVGLHVRTGPHKQDLRAPFSEAQLRRIFSSKKWKATKDTKPARYWVPLLSLFGGLRLSEACQLLRDDVREVEGIWCVHVEPGKGKRVKSRAGQRVVPVHPKLIEMGFIEFVRGVNDERLFGDLAERPDGYAGEALSKAFTRFVVRIGADAPRTSFHSFRHNFRDMMREAKVPQEIAQALGGWAGNGGTSSLYGGGYTVKTLAEEIGKIKPPVKL